MHFLNIIIKTGKGIWLLLTRIIVIFFTSILLTITWSAILIGICISPFVKPASKNKIKKLPKKKLSIIIVNWNCKEYIRNCLKSVFEDIDDKTEVIVVDNNSKDGSIEIVEKEFPKAKLIKNKENVGFSKANNQGIEVSEGKYILTLNPDIVLTKGCASKLIKAAESDPKIGSVTGKLLNMKRPELIDSVGHDMYLVRAAQNKGSMHRDINQFNAGYVFGVCAAAALYKREMLEDIQINNEYFDEEFFAYCEDVDLDWHANLRGWKSYFTNTAVAYHARGVTTGSGPKLFLSSKNRYFMVLKNDFLVSILKSFFAIFLYSVMYQSAHFGISIKASIAFYKSYFKMLKKRKCIHNNLQISRKEMEKKFTGEKEFLKENAFLKKKLRELSQKSNMQDH